MTEDNVASKVGLMYELDENINQLKAKCLFPCSSNAEDNQNIFFMSSHTVSMIQKLSELKELSSNGSHKHRSDQAEITTTQLEKNIFQQTSQNSASSKSVLKKSDKTLDVVETLASKTCPGSSLPPAETFYQGGIGKDLSSSAYRYTEFGNLPLKQSFANTEDYKESLPSNAVIENHSEAGPDVAQFSEEELRSVAELFKEPSAFDFFQKAGSSKLLRESPLGQLSLFVKANPSYKSRQEGTRESSQNSEIGAELRIEPDEDKSLLNITMSTDSKNASPKRVKDLIDFNCPPKKSGEKGANQSPQPVQHTGNKKLHLPAKEEHKTFTEEEFSQAVKMQELLYQQTYLRREKERSDQSKHFENEMSTLNNQVIALQNLYDAVRVVLEELMNKYNVCLTAQEQDREKMTIKIQEMKSERNQALEDLESVENAFSDLHRRYENCKTVLDGYKQNEDKIRKQVADLEVQIEQQKQMYQMLTTRTRDTLERANVEIESTKKSGDAEVTILGAQLKKAEIRISSLEKDIEQKN